MMISVKKLASAVGGKTARACDSCIKKRARWYCAADDAFLCQACDSSVHSANLLAGRHERLRLKTASTEQTSDQLPSWHHGFKRKPRTPRKHNKSQRNPIHLVPEIGRDDNLFEESDEPEQLLYQVPTFDEFAAQLWNSNEGKKRNIENDHEENEGGKYLLGTVNYDCNLHGFGQSNKDAEEFTVDVDSLLGKGLDGESFDMETLGFLDCREKDLPESSTSTGTELKQEEEEEEEEDDDDGQAVIRNTEFDITDETFELNSDDYDSPGNYEEDKTGVNGTRTSVDTVNEDCGMGNDDMNENKKNILLALDYEGVIAAWADQKSPWINGGRPEVDPNDCWPDCMDVCEGIKYQPYGEMGGNNISAGMLDGGREARVLRYREKRRNRLFSKKIRYEVRKLNAEKRPRLKGRFVKRETSSTNISPLLISK